jgi:hypothetical protein
MQLAELRATRAPFELLFKILGINRSLIKLSSADQTEYFAWEDQYPDEFRGVNETKSPLENGNHHLNDPSKFLTAYGSAISAEAYTLDMNASKDMEDISKMR